MIKNVNLNSLNSLKGLRVLYVEDDNETREELEVLLKNQVKGLYVANNGLDGLKFYKKHKPDIVITDIQMSGMSGLSMSADIRLMEPEQNIIILSAHNDVEYIFRAMELGIQNYLIKPVSIEQLLKQLVKIAEQLQLQAEIKRSRKLLDQYKLMVDEQAIVVKFDHNGEITYANDRFCVLSGYSKKELTGNVYPFLYQFDDQAKSYFDFQRQLTNNKKWHGVVKNKAKNGDAYVVDVTVTAIIDEAEQVEEYVALMVDITNLLDKQELLSLDLKKDLKQQKHFLSEYERALEIGTSLCVVDPEGKIRSANQNFSSSLNCQPKDLIGQTFFTMLLECNNSQDLTHFKRNIFKNVQSKGHCAELFKIKFREGPIKTFSTIIVGLYDLQGKIHSYIAISQDISESVKLNEEILDTQKEFIYLMGEVVENRSQETGKHLKRVALISKFLAEKYGLTDEFSQMLKITSPMHDIGKIGIPDAILHKPGRLTKNESKTMKTHSELGFNILKVSNKPLMQMAAKIAHEHHEHFDGSGYPNGLVGENISIEARIVALVDVFDALGSKRVYKEPWSDEAILAYILEKKTKQFDPEIVDLFTDNYAEIVAIRDQFKD
jgi:PAS domain S-box-containing protein